MSIKIISGGQTGVDTLALIWAKTNILVTGGTMPKNFRTEEGNKPEFAEKYGMIESDKFDYRSRTKQNILDSDFTIVFGNTKTPGTKLTIKLCDQYKKVCLINPDPQQVYLNYMFLKKENVVINIAGNRKSGLTSESAMKMLWCLDNFLMLYKSKDGITESV